MIVVSVLLRIPEGIILIFLQSGTRGGVLLSNPVEDSWNNPVKDSIKYLVEDFRWNPIEILRMNLVDYTA